MKTYILKECLTEEERNIKRLQQFVNWCLRVDGEMTKALEAEAMGKHREGDSHDYSVPHGGDA